MIVVVSASTNAKQHGNQTIQFKNILRAYVRQWQAWHAPFAAFAPFHAKFAHGFVLRLKMVQYQQTHLLPGPAFFLVLLRSIHNKYKPEMQASCCVPVEVNATASIQDMYTIMLQIESDLSQPLGHLLTAVLTLNRNIRDVTLPSAVLEESKPNKQT